MFPSMKTTNLNIAIQHALNTSPVSGGPGLYNRRERRAMRKREEDDGATHRRATAGSGATRVGHTAWVWNVTDAATCGRIPRGRLSAGDVQPHRLDDCLRSAERHLDGLGRHAVGD